MESNPPRDALFYPEASWNRYQSDVYALGVSFLLIAFNGREDIKRSIGTAEVTEAVAALGEDAEELKKRLRIMLGVAGERLDFVGLDEVITGRKRQPPLPKPAPILLPKPSIVLPPKPSFVPFKPSIKKEQPSVLPASPQPLVPAKPSVLPTNNDVPQAFIPPKPSAVGGFPKAPMNPLAQGIAKPGPEAGKPALVPSGNNESKSAEPRVGVPLSFPKPNFGPQDKLETVPKASGEEAKPGPQSVKPPLPPIPKFGQPFQPLKKQVEGGNDSPAVPQAANPLSIPKIGPVPKFPVPASPYSKSCPKCKSPLSGDVCLICTADKANSPAVVPLKPGAFLPKQGIAAMPVPGGNRAPIAAPMPQPLSKPGPADLITKATDKKECVCKNCGNQFRKKFSASPDYDKQFEDFCSEDCAFAFAASQ